MKKRIISAVLSFAMVTSLAVSNCIGTAANENIPAFPGAEGGGKYTTGGRGYDIYIVDSLLDYNPATEKPIKGTLRHGVSGNNRTIVFNVGGVIELKDSLFIDGKNITIAGQTAPGDGITVYGHETNISDSENIIIRYIRFRTGSKNVFEGDSKDALWGRFMKNLIIDHVSASWSTDEVMSLYRAENMTVQWSIISESLAMSGHTKGRHGYGGIWGGVNTTFHHNLIAGHTSRTPRMSGGTIEGDGVNYIANFDIRNNVIYNWGFNTCYGGGNSNVNFVNNYSKPGPATYGEVKKRLIDVGETNKIGKFYISGNVLEGSPEITKNNSLGIYMASAAAPTTEIVKSEFKFAGNNPQDLTTDTAESAYKKVTAYAGAVLPRRDAHDQRIINEVKSGMGNIANTEFETGGLPYTTTEKRAPTFDKDMDGMADAWEEENGLSPIDSRDGKLVAENGYTNLENYLNSLVEMDYEPKNPTITVNHPIDNQIFPLGKAIDFEVKAGGANPIDRIEFYVGGKKIETATRTDGIYKTQITGLNDGTYYLTAKAIDVDGNQTNASSVTVHVNTPNTDIGVWRSTDIGDTPIKGNTVFYGENTVNVKGSGKIGGTADSFRYVYQPVSGDFDISVKVDSVTPVDHHAFSGIIARENLTVGSKEIMVGLSHTKSYEWSEKDPSTGKSITYYRNPFGVYQAARNDENAVSDEIGETLDSLSNAEKAGIVLAKDIPMKDRDQYIGYYLRMTRIGDTFKTYHSEDGVEWIPLGEKTLYIAEDAYIGLAVDANQQKNGTNNLNTVKFSNINLGEPTIIAESVLDMEVEAEPLIYS